METKLYYNSRGQKPDGSWDNFLDSITGDFELVNHHMGGNYGLADEYIVTTQDGKFNMQYFGDGSAEIKKIIEE